MNFPELHSGEPLAITDPGPLAITDPGPGLNYVYLVLSVYLRHVLNYALRQPLAYLGDTASLHGSRGQPEASWCQWYGMSQK